VRHRDGRAGRELRPFGRGLTALPSPESASASELDARDPLAHFAAEFHHPVDAGGRRAVYLCGHSLGLQPKSAASYVSEELVAWRRLGVLGHHHGTRPWIGYHEHAARGLASLAGASELEVVAMNSLTINLHLMMVSFFRPDGPRNCVLIEKSAFPSDRYAVLSQLGFHGLDARYLIELEPRPGEHALRMEDIIATLEREGPRLALVLWPGVQYLSGQLFDLGAITAAAHAAGAVVGLDLAHAIGNVPLQLHDWNADFAVWCSYKYLNAGPGAIGGCFVHQRHAQRPDLPRFTGWWGHDKARRFEMGPDFRPIAGAEGWQVSNPPVLSAAPLLASLELFGRAGLSRLREKSLQLTAFMQRSLQSRVGAVAEVITPREAAQRGSQLSVRLALPSEAARRCHERLTAAGVIGDWREPDTLRFAPVALYNSFRDVAAAVDALAAAVAA
jgi:kynureninase